MKSRNIRIFLYIQNSPGKSSVEIAHFFHISRIAVYKHLKKLISENKIYTSGKGKNTRYFETKQYNHTIISNNFYSNVLRNINDEYEGLENINIPEILNNLLSYLRANGEWKYGMDAFIERIKKENNNTPPSEELLQERLEDFLLSFSEEESKRRKNGFFNGTKSLEHILKSYNMPSRVDQIIFTQIATLSYFGRLRGANEIYWGKKDQNEALLHKGISRGIDIIAQYIHKNNITHCIYTPPTMKRKIQFRAVLKKLLEKNKINLISISCTKKKSEHLTLKAQKDTKGLDRIINARTSMTLQDMRDHLNIPEIVIFDDNFTTGSTINSIAEMMRSQGYNHKITAITLTGNFEYIPGITDEGDI